MAKVTILLCLQNICENEWEAPCEQVSSTLLILSLIPQHMTLWRESDKFSTQLYHIGCVKDQKNMMLNVLVASGYGRNNEREATFLSLVNPLADLKATGFHSKRMSERAAQTREVPLRRHERV